MSLPGRHRRKTRHKVEPLPSQAIDALRRGPEDERLDATRGFVVPSAAELMAQDDYQEAYRMVKADLAQRPQRGVAMSQIQIGGEGAYQGLLLQRPVGLSHEQLRAAGRVPTLSLIRRTRIAQVKTFLAQPQFDWQPGYKLRFKDLSRKVQPEDVGRFSWLRDFLTNCGAEFDPRKRRALQRTNLHEFTTMHLEDSLVMDSAPIEYVQTSSGRVHGFNSVDGAKVFLTDPNAGLTEDFAGPAEFNRLTGRTSFGDPRNIIAVYAQDGVARAQYTHMDLLYPVRNRVADESYFGYGAPEIEAILNILTALTDTFTLNSRSISDNSIPRGFFTAFGDFTDEESAEMKRFFATQMRGAQNRGRVPLFMGGADPGSSVQFNPTGAQIEEVMFSRWWTLLTAIACSEYLMDPSEIAHESFNAGGTSSLSGSDTEAKLTSSSDKGLNSLLTWFGGSLTEIIQTVDPEVELYWTGLNDTKEDDQQREQTAMTYGEVRERHGLSNDGIPPEVLGAPSGVAGQVYMSTVQAKQQEKMQAQQAAAGGGPDQAQPGQDGDDQGEGPDDQAQPGTTPADPEHPTGPDGEQRFGDRQGNVWQQEKPGTVAKAAYTPALLPTWPGEAE